MMFWECKKYLSKPDQCSKNSILRWNFCEYSKLYKISILKKDKNILKWREESDTYLTRVCRHRWSRKSPVKIKYQELSANIVAFSDVYRRESCRYRSLSLILKCFLSFCLPRFPFYIDNSEKEYLETERAIVSFVLLN